MRIRYIKPGICSNEDIADCGPYGYILNTGLWMYADKEGRFEWRPRKIKAEVMPLWDDVSAAMVERLLEALVEHGFLTAYEVDGKRYAAVNNWEKHQNPHVRESESVLPAPPNAHRAPVAATRADAPVTEDAEKAVPRHNLGDVEPGGLWVMGNGYRESSSSSTSTSCQTAKPDDDETPTLEKTKPLPRKAPPRRTVNTAQSPPKPKPKPPQQAASAQQEHPPEFYVSSWLRDYVRTLRQCDWGEPDPEIVRRILRALGGNSLEELEEFLYGLFQRRLGPRQSWGWFLAVVEERFGEVPNVQRRQSVH